MREILFRGKLRGDGRWAEGNLVVRKDGVCIITPDDTPLGCYGQVVPATVGQYTGLTDKYGRKIFEWDVVDIGEHISTVNGLYIVFFDTVDHCWALKRDDGYFHTYFSFSDLNGFADSSEVVGNIHDNPELMKGGD